MDSYDLPSAPILGEETVTSYDKYNSDLYSGDFFEDKEFKSSITQFTAEGENFFPCTKTVKSLPNGYYRIMRDYSRGIYMRKIPVKLNRLVILEHSCLYNVVMKDIMKFWESKEEYKKRGKLHRRNILLHSEPGMGKTSLINLIVNDLITNRNGFVISISSPVDIQNFNEAMTIIRNVMPEKPIIIIIEDVDNFISSNGKDTVETELLNILDGLGTFENMLTIATTNYPEQLTERYINRPSRFNRVIEIPLPDAELRREFLIKTNIKEDIDRIDLDEWVRKTEGYTIDFLKELSDSVFISGNTEEETFKLLDEMRSKRVVKNQSKLSGLGFIS